MTEILYRLMTHDVIAFSSPSDIRHQPTMIDANSSASGDNKPCHVL
jgi:hypothetical protein